MSEIRYFIHDEHSTLSRLNLIPVLRIRFSFLHLLNRSLRLIRSFVILQLSFPVIHSLTSCFKWIQCWIHFQHFTYYPRTFYSNIMSCYERVPLFFSTKTFHYVSTLRSSSVKVELFFIMAQRSSTPSWKILFSVLWIITIFLRHNFIGYICFVLITLHQEPD